MKKLNVLIVEDDPAMQAGLRDNLQFEGYEVLTARTVREARVAALSRHPDLLLLDVMLPDGNGFELCRQLRSLGFSKPILMLTAKGEEMARVVGLESGADDYVVKPFSLRELLARVRAHLRRANINDMPPDVVQVGISTVDLARHVLTRDGENLETSAKEFAFLQCMLAHRGKIVSREMLLAEVWKHQENVVTRAVDNIVVRIRRKIEPDPVNPRYLLTIHGSGYKLVEQ